MPGAKASEKTESTKSPPTSYNYCMSEVQWKELEVTVANMSPEERLRLGRLLGKPQSSADAQSAVSSSAKSPAAKRSAHSSIGCMSDEAELLDEVVRNAMEARGNDPFRATQ